MGVFIVPLSDMFTTEWSPEVQMTLTQQTRNVNLFTEYDSNYMNFTSNNEIIIDWANSKSDVQFTVKSQTMMYKNVYIQAKNQFSRAISTKRHRFYVHCPFASASVVPAAASYTKYIKKDTPLAQAQFIFDPFIITQNTPGCGMWYMSTWSHQHTTLLKYPSPLSCSWSNKQTCYTVDILDVSVVKTITFKVWVTLYSIASAGNWYTNSYFDVTIEVVECTGLENIAMNDTSPVTFLLTRNAGVTITQTMSSFMGRFSSDLAKCPIGFLELWDYPLGASATTATEVSITAAYDINSSFFSVDVNVGFQRPYTLRVQSFSQHQYLDLLVIFDICQTSAQLLANMPTLKLQLKQEATALNLPQTDFIGNFTVEATDCPFSLLELYDEVDPSLVSSKDTNLDVSLVGIDWLVTLTKTAVHTGIQYLRFQTSDTVGQAVKIEYQICSENSITLADTSPFELTFAKDSTTHNLTFTTDIETRFSVSDCSNCPISLYKILDEDKNDFTGTEIQLDSVTNDLTMQSANAFEGTFYLQATHDNLTNAACSYILPNQIEINYEVCGNEEITPSSTDALVYNVTVGTDVNKIVLSKADIEGTFTTNSTKCNMTIFIDQKSSGAETLASAAWNSFVTFDSVATTLEIDHVGNYMQSLNHSISIYLRAISAGSKEASREITINFNYKIPDNIAPTFSGTFAPQSIELTEDEQLGGLADPSFTYTSGQATDGEGDIIKIQLMLTVPCGCAATTDNGDGTFTITIDKTKLTILDAGAHQLSIITKDDNFSESKLMNTYMMIIEIKYTEAEKEEEISEQAAAVETEEEVGEVGEEEAEGEGEQSEEEIEEEVKEADKPETDGAEVLGAAFNPWVQKASAEDMALLMAAEMDKGSSSQFAGFVAEEEPEPVLLKVGTITRNGVVKVTFNQKLKVPGFIDQPSDKTEAAEEPITDLKGRQVIALSELEVTRDVFDFDFVLKSDIEKEDIKFFLEITEWNQEGISVYCNFTNPLLISKGLASDRVIIKIKNRKLFKALESEEVLMTDRIYIQENFPRQLPTGVVEEDIKAEAATASNGMKAIVFVQLALQICLKGSLNELWTLFFTLQIMCYMSIYDTPIPSNTEIYVEEFTKLIEFDILKPESFIKSTGIDPDFVLIDWLMAKKDELQAPKNAEMEGSMFQDLQFYIIGLGCFIVFLICTCGAFLCLKKYKEKIKELLVKIKKKVMWNMVIRSLTIAYIQMCMTCGFQLELWLRDTETQTEEDKKIGLSMFICLFAWPVIAILILRWKRESLNKQETKDLYGNLYSEVKLRGEHNRDAIWYYPIFLIRRIVFVAIPTFLYLWPFGQLQLLIFLTTLYIIFYSGLQPHLDLRRTYLENFNEVMTMLMNYHMTTFTMFNLDANMQFQMGYSYVAHIMFTIFVNLVFMVFKQISTFKRKRMLKQLKASHDARLLWNHLREKKRNAPKTKKKKTIKKAETQQIEEADAVVRKSIKSIKRVQTDQMNNQKLVDLQANALDKVNNRIRIPSKFKSSQSLKPRFKKVVRMETIKEVEEFGDHSPMKHNRNNSISLSDEDSDRNENSMRPMFKKLATANDWKTTKTQNVKIGGFTDMHPLKKKQVSQNYSVTVPLESLPVENLVAMASKEDVNSALQEVLAEYGDKEIDFEQLLKDLKLS